MAIDTSIYGLLKPVQMPSLMNSMEGAARLSSLAQQRERNSKLMEREDEEAKRAAHRWKVSAIGGAVDSLKDMSEQERAGAWSTVRKQLVDSGAIRPEDAPEEYDPGYFRSVASAILPAYRKSQEYIDRDHKIAQTEKLRSEAAYAAREKKSGTKLPADKVMALASARQVPALLDDLKTTVEANEGSFGPVAGRLSMMNPYSETAKTIDAQTRTVRQTIGKLKEGGVLRKEDEEKYAKMLPEMTDTPAVARNKIELVRREMMRDFQSNVSALADAGYDVSAFGDSFNQTVPDLPSAIAGRSKSGFGPSARAGEPSPEDMEALHWLRRNPNSPDAAGVRARLERKGLL